MFFFRNDAVQRPLQQPYSGPYKVLKRLSKTFIIDYRGKRQCVSKDRLKPAYLANNKHNEDMHKNVQNSLLPHPRQGKPFRKSSFSWPSQRLFCGRNGSTVAVATTFK